MATLYTNLVIFSILLFIKPHFIATQTSFRPKALVLPITKDPSTNQYLTTINQRTPLVPVKLTLDLGGPNLWTDCEHDFVSSTYKHAICGSAQCKAPSRLTVCTQCFIPPNTPGCHTDSCGFLADNPITGTIFVNAEIGQDVVSIRSTNGSNPGRPVSAPRFIFTCAITSMLEGLASGVKGVAGLGRNRISLPQQLASTFSFRKKFALCLSSMKNGVVFFGDGPYFLQPNNIDVAKSLIFTPLILNPVNPGKSHFEPDPSPEYFIGVSSIKINGNTVPLNKTLLKINKKGHGGTKISTAHPYTIMHSSIYNAFINTFIKELARVPRVPAVAPFGVCYNSTFISSTRVGPGVPAIDLVLQSSDVYWRIFGSNSMVEVKKDVICLAFVDGGSSETMNSIVIGGHQLEDNLLQFDLASSRLGFSSSLLFRQTTCANFDFTSTA